VRDFLDAKGIRFVDLTFRFRARGLAASELYWRRDPHINLRETVRLRKP